MIARGDDLEVQLQEAITAEIGDDPFPPGFVESLVATLPQRQRRHRPNLGIGLTISAAMVVVLVIGVFLWRGTAPFVGTVSKPGKAEFQGLEFRFEYPDTWRVIALDEDLTRYLYVPVVVGIGDWEHVCTFSSAGRRCLPTTFSVPPGGVVVQVSQRYGPAGPYAPSPDAITLPDGGRADVSDSELTSEWQILPPSGAYTLVVEAQYSELNVETSRTQVRALVESLIWQIPSAS